MTRLLTTPQPPPPISGPCHPPRHRPGPARPGPRRLVRVSALAHSLPANPLCHPAARPLPPYPQPLPAAVRCPAQPGPRSHRAPQPQRESAERVSELARGASKRRRRGAAPGDALRTVLTGGAGRRRARSGPAHLPRHPAPPAGSHPARQPFPPAAQPARRGEAARARRGGGAGGGGGEGRGAESEVVVGHELDLRGGWGGT